MSIPESPSLVSTTVTLFEQPTKCLYQRALLWSARPLLFLSGRPNVYIKSHQSGQERPLHRGGGADQDDVSWYSVLVMPSPLTWRPTKIMSPRIDSWSCLSPHLVSRTKNDVSSYRHSDANQRHIRGINAPQTPLSPTSQGKPGPSPLPSRTLPLRHTRRRRPNWWPPVCAGPAYSIPPICSRRGGDPTHHGGVPSCGCA